MTIDQQSEIKRNPDFREIEGHFYEDQKPISLQIVDGQITRINRKQQQNISSQKKIYIGPGLIDIQINGYKGNNFTGSDLTIKKIKNVVEDMYKVGVTSFLPTIITTSYERLIKNFSVLKEALNDPFIRRSIPGFHLEGPYINPEDGYRGAHNKEWIQSPNWSQFQKINQAADGKIRLISLAPEMKGGLEFIRKARQTGLVVAIAHHNAPAEIIREAVNAGVTLSTHLGNGIADSLHRRENPLWAQLAENRLKISIIVDGFHLSEEQVNVFYSIKGADNTILVSDMTDLAGMPPGNYFWDNKNVELQPEGVIHFPEQKVLAGAALSLIDDVENMISITSCSLKEGLNMASLNPAKFLGLKYCGDIKKGKRADLILFSYDGNKIDLYETIVNGETVYKKNNLEVST
jgi:N-acetylglucosamine-6-phosphate deacetylase